MIEDRKRLRALGASSKVNAEWRFLRHLFAIGRAAAERWLEAHAQDVGRCGTLDLRQMFEGTPSPRAGAVRPGGSAPDDATPAGDVA
jgi:NTE family protein